MRKARPARRVSEPVTSCESEGCENYLFVIHNIKVELDEKYCSSVPLYPNSEFLLQPKDWEYVQCDCVMKLCSVTTGGTKTLCSQRAALANQILLRLPHLYCNRHGNRVYRLSHTHTHTLPASSPPLHCAAERLSAGVGFRSQALAPPLVPLVSYRIDF